MILCGLFIEDILVVREFWMVMDDISVVREFSMIYRAYLSYEEVLDDL